MYAETVTGKGRGTERESTTTSRSADSPTRVVGALSRGIPRYNVALAHRDPTDHLLTGPNSPGPSRSSLIEHRFRDYPRNTRPQRTFHFSLSLFAYYSLLFAIVRRAN